MKKIKELFTSHQSGTKDTDIHVPETRCHEKSDFLANISHEIRTPLNTILGCNEMILMESEESRTISCASNIQTAGRTLLSMVNNIMDYAAVDKGTIALRHESYPTFSMLKDILAYAAYHTEKNNLELMLDIDETLPRTLVGDMARLIQIVNNLISNAVKYTRQGFVKLIVEWHPGEENKGKLSVFVIDSGIGTEQNGDIQGTELDIPIAIKLLALMGSSLNIENEYGRGSCLSFVLIQEIADNEPVGKIEPEQVFAAETGRESLYAPNARLLAVDDTPMNLHVFKGILRHTGIQIDTAASGPEAIALLEKNPYHIIFLDHMMPDPDGIETLHIIRKRHLCPDTPVIVLTANAVPGAREKYLEEGFCDYLSKPVTQAPLCAMIKKYLPQELLMKEQPKNPVLAADVPPKELSILDTQSSHILVVDDEPMNLRIAERMLEKSFCVSCAKSGKEALELLKKELPQLILLDLHMPEMDGFQMLRILKEQKSCRDIPVIFLTADNDRDMEVKCFQEGAMDFITKPFIADIMISRVKRILELDGLKRHLQQEVDKRTRESEERREKVERMSLQIMQTLSRTIDAKDKYTNGHSVRVSEYSREIARRMGKSEKEQQDIYFMGLLHDIGKIGIPDEIINKPSRLTREEYAVIQSHPVIGAEILKNISELPEIATGARWHHERYDGKGYPDGLAGENIPLAARIIGVADTYDAMTSKRSYRDTLPQKTVIDELKKGRGTQLDPVCTDIMLQMIAEDANYQMREKTTP